MLMKVMLASALLLFGILPSFNAFYNIAIGHLDTRRWIEVFQVK